MPLQVADADFSPCRKYRYLLRYPRAASKRVLWVALNPSTADECQLDPTLRRCFGFAKRWGFDGIEVANLFAFRATDPKVMLAEASPVGPENNKHILQAAARSALVVAAWGVHGSHMGRDEEVLHALRLVVDVVCLGKTKEKFPRHPLYVKGDCPYIPL
jgi:hypothetical protein